MATKEIINFHSEYEEYEGFDDPAWPATHNTVNYQTHNQTNSQATEARIQAFRRKKLGRSALRSFDLGRLAL